jgi:hypothetical protein
VVVVVVCVCVCVLGGGGRLRSWNVPGLDMCESIHGPQMAGGSTPGSAAKSTGVVFILDRQQ